MKWEIASGVLIALAIRGALKIGFMVSQDKNEKIGNKIIAWGLLIGAGLAACAVLVLA